MIALPPETTALDCCTRQSASNSSVGVAGAVTAGAEVDAGAAVGPDAEVDPGAEVDAGAEVEPRAEVCPGTDVELGAEVDPGAEVAGGEVDAVTLAFAFDGAFPAAAPIPAIAGDALPASVAGAQPAEAVMVMATHADRQR
jgi:hypothetical protein